MGITTVDSLKSGYRATVQACDRCEQPSAVVAGTPGRMLCNDCEAGVNEALEQHAESVKAAQSKARRASKIEPEAAE